MSQPPPVNDDSAPAAPAPAPEPISALAVLGLIAAVVVPAVGVVVSSVALGRTGPGKQRGRGLALAGVVMGAILTVLGTVVAVAAFRGAQAVVEQIPEPPPAPTFSLPSPPAPPDGPGDETDQETTDDLDIAVPSTFAELSADEWAEITRDPAAYEGDGVVLFANVDSFPTGDIATYFGQVSPVQPADEFELSDPVYFLDPEGVIPGVADGDVLRVDAVVTSREIAPGDPTPILVAVRAEAAELADLTGNVVLGPPEPTDVNNGTRIPVTITNNGDTVTGFIAEVVATSADGSTQYGTTPAIVDSLQPGQVGETEAFFFDLPPDAVFDVLSVQRTP
jgi:hypothetical protein